MIHTYPDHPESSIQKARKNRKNQTEPERVFWTFVRNNKLGTKFRRQVPMGPYILDFFCFEHSLAVELDGNQHLKKEAREYDQARNEFLQSYGITTLRFSNSDFMDDPSIVISKVLSAIKSSEPKSPLTPSLSLRERGNTSL
ncbi:MAG: endonuclease domain-containing protein [Bacteroidota bacterium]